MKKYPKIGIRPTIDGRQGGVRESLEEKTMNLAKAVAELITSNLKNGDGSPVECVIAYASDEQKVMESGFDGYMPKPINAKLLKAQLVDIMQKRIILL